MNLTVRSLLLCAVAAMIVGAGPVRAAPEQDESLGQKVKKFFTQPTPRPRKRHKTSPTATPAKKAKAKPSPSVSASTSAGASASPPATPAPSESPVATPSPSARASASPSSKPTPEATLKRRKALSEPVRAISPGPRRRHPESPSPRPAKTPPGKTPPPSHIAPSATASPSATVAAGESEKGNGTRGPVATLPASEIAGYENYPPRIRQILDRSLSLTTQNLGYKYGSADPANGGMDCSGFVHYILSQTGMAEVPRDARELYIWLRKAGTFQAVLAHRDDSFELDALKPGDLLFWSGTYHTDRDPDITHTMIYLGREKGSNQRVMVGSSDGRSYKGQSRFGVSVFDFKVAPRRAPKKDEGPGPVFVGYGRIPGLDESHE